MKIVKEYTYYYYLAEIVTVLKKFIIVYRNENTYNESEINLLIRSHRNFLLFEFKSRIKCRTFAKYFLKKEKKCLCQV